MKFDDKHTFDKPAATVIKMFSDRAYFERKYKELGGWDIEVLEHEKSATKFRIKVRYSMKSNVPLPDFAKKFVAAEMNIVQRDSWDLGKRIGKLEVELRGLPLTVEAAMKLADISGGSANILSWDVRCGVPLFGGKLEKLLLSDIQAKADASILAAE